MLILVEPLFLKLSRPCYRALLRLISRTVDFLFSINRLSEFDSSGRKFLQLPIKVTSLNECQLRNKLLSDGELLQTLRTT